MGAVLFAILQLRVWQAHLPRHRHFLQLSREKPEHCRTILNSEKHPQSYQNCDEPSSHSPLHSLTHTHATSHGSPTILLACTQISCNKNITHTGHAILAIARPCAYIRAHCQSSKINCNSLDLYWVAHSKAKAPHLTNERRVFLHKLRKIRVAILTHRKYFVDDRKYDLWCSCIANHQTNMYLLVKNN